MPDISKDCRNWTIRGVSIDSFVFVTFWLHARRLLWSSVLDKKGDWLVSTEDHTPGDAILQLFADGKLWDRCDVVEYGELTTCLTDNAHAAAERLMKAAAAGDFDHMACYSTNIRMKILSDVRTVCEAVLAGPQWQPIETAPKDAGARATTREAADKQSYDDLAASGGIVDAP